jgi:alpha-1,2-mannosyltransferase
MRSLLIFYLLAAAGLFGFAAGAGLTGSLILAIPIAIVFMGLTGFVLWKFRIVAIEKTACSRGLQVLSGVAIVVALVQLARLTVFMIAPSQVAYSTVPSSRWEIQHSCLSAYYIADQSLRNVPDVYANSLYSMPDDDPNSVRKPRMLGPFKIDVYLNPDFLPVRMIWFAFNGIVVIIAMLMVARALGPVAGTRAMLLAPLVWASLPFLGTLQKGNIQMTIIAISMIAMLLFARRKNASGGLLLAFATVSKIYPGMLIVYLFARRQWRAVAFTCAMSVLLVMTTLLIMDRQTYSAFLAHLPGLLGGEAFPAFRNPSATAINYSVPGIIFKLKLFGVPDMNFGAMKVIGWIYTLILLAIILVIARRTHRTDVDSPLIWIAILILATLRSPFLPQAYAGFPPLWLLTLVAATYAPTPKMLIIVILVWLSLNIVLPQDWGVAPRLLALITAVPQLATIGLALVALGEPEGNRDLNLALPA